MVANKQEVRFGKNIKRALQKRNKSQSWLARQVGNSRQHVNIWCSSNGSNPDLEYTMRIADALDYSIDEIVTGQFRDEMKKVNLLNEFEPIINDELDDIDEIMGVLAYSSKVSARSLNLSQKRVRAKINSLLELVSEGEIAPPHRR